MAAILEKFVDADQWEAEDIVGRLGNGHGRACRLPLCRLPALRRPTTAGSSPPEARGPGGLAVPLPLVHRATAGAPRGRRRRRADGARARERRHALMLLTAGGDWRGGAYLERLDAATVTPLLSRALADAEPWASRVCWALADGACWGLFAELCRGNGLPLTGFMSLTDDVKVEILKRLAGADDFARMERTCRDLRRLVAERDGELWKPMYEALRAQRRRCRRGGRWGLSFLLRSEISDSESEEEVLSWKEKFMEARQRLRDMSFWRRTVSGSLSPFPPSHCTELSSCLLEWLTLLDPPEQETVSTRGKSTAGHRRKVPRTRNVDKKKWHGGGAGAIPSPSSRYRWKHR
ncbi:hypothetical protein PAHAL_5G245800 [Panicum hallii]|jgi:hypothetical protein|uniref:F-box domain-containing protein n=1 Tax=Panicum hallii TaxID=206008 RepID=A0A2S3HTY7_9POAL|nr:hypothetical protein PAHAL_5G245800 [Panicum hallii]